MVNEHSNGYGITFSNIQPDNIMVIAAVFNSEWHQRYAVPPDGAPFDAYYIDDVSAAVPSVDENPPELSIENPAEGYLHIFGRKIVPVGLTVIIGDITVKATAKDDEAGVGSVEFYVDDELEKRYNFSALRMGMG